MPAAGDKMSAAGDRMPATDALLSLTIRRKVYRPAGAEPVEAVRDLAVTIRAGRPCA